MTTDPLSVPLSVADRLFAAIEAGDVDTVRGLYAPNAEVWHNTDGIAQTREENLRTLGWLTSHLKDIRYTDIRRQATEDGFVQEHVLTAVRPDGVSFELPACIVATVRDGHITRIAEHLDSAHVARIVSTPSP